MPTIAYVVSSHGFGHAARAAAVIDALARRSSGPDGTDLDGTDLDRADLDIQVITTTPRWFFEQSLETSFGYHELTTDLGLVQASSLDEDLDASISRLEAMLADPDRLVGPIVGVLERIAPELVVCDISPWGLEAARRLGLPSALAENFTWHWIYRGYGDDSLDRLADRLEPLFAADHHFRLEPFCGPMGSAIAVPPVARRPRRPREEVREALGVPQDASMALVTMGGVPWHFDDIEGQLGERSSEHVLVVAGGAPEMQRYEGCVLIPHQSDFYHPDLVAAADLVVGKLGYSTVAEVSENGGAFLYVPRPRFRESPALEAWVQEHMASLRFAPTDLVAANWLTRLDAALDQLAQLPAKSPRGGGAETLAKALTGLI